MDPGCIKSAPRPATSTGSLLGTPSQPPLAHRRQNVVYDASARLTAWARRPHDVIIPRYVAIHISESFLDSPGWCAPVSVIDAGMGYPSSALRQSIPTPNPPQRVPVVPGAEDTGPLGGCKCQSPYSLSNGGYGGATCQPLARRALHASTPQTTCAKIPMIGCAQCLIENDELHGVERPGTTRRCSFSGET
jgi:hypothetical protein